MTKTEAKKQLRTILEKLGEVKDLIDDLKSETEDTANSIEPYENRNDLTELQQERQEWFEDVTSDLENAYDSIEEIESNLDDKANF